MQRCASLIDNINDNYVCLSEHYPEVNMKVVI